jgi:hypothetical protein
MNSWRVAWLLPLLILGCQKPPPPKVQALPDGGTEQDFFALDAPTADLLAHASGGKAYRLHATDRDTAPVLVSSEQLVALKDALTPVKNVDLNGNRKGVTFCTQNPAVEVEVSSLTRKFDMQIGFDCFEVDIDVTGIAGNKLYSFHGLFFEQRAALLRWVQKLMPNDPELSTIQLK